MPTEAEIKAKYKALHDTLSESYYAGTSGLTKEEFDLQHGQIWNDMRGELIQYGYIIPPELPTPCPEFGVSNPSHSLEKKVRKIEVYLEVLSVWCKARFG